MAFLGPDDILVLQKNNGRVRRVLGGVLQPDPVLDVAVDNDERARPARHRGQHAAPPRVFLYYTEINDPDGDGLPDGGTPLGNRVYRYTWNAALGAARESPARPRSAGHRGSEPQRRRPPARTDADAGSAPPVGDGSLLYAVIGDLNRDGQLENFPGGTGARRHRA